ncbi:MAG: mandelate racemase/muconate lactonizing enzyme family protein [Rikenellaceae bacterium]|jgi:L-alanine-DL-glutamate epimerase-like enolase superfamily enzyme|nr:mandelate racemase/muconate lactonizing enzyme family protein [Rikenellaceae bacterium]
MKMTRREWLRMVGVAAVASAMPRSLQAAIDYKKQVEPVIREFEKPMFDIPGQVAAPAIVESIELLRSGNSYFVRTRSKDGAVGITGTKQINDFIPIFTNLVAPHFIGKDARNIESLVDSVCQANYKLVGIPFWSPVAYVEQSLFDMLGKMAGKPVGEMLGGVVRDEIPVYLSGSDRILSAEEEVDVYVRGVAETGAKMVKFKIGGRMSRNVDAYPGRTETLLELARKKLGDKIILATDANGTYDIPNAIRIGRIMEGLGYAFFEEPCPWENFMETKAVAHALDIPVALGEQHSSFPQFQWMLENDVMRIVQPDINYNGGLVRIKRVARMAEWYGRDIVPHNTQTGAVSVNILQFASCTPNAQPYMEYPWRAPRQTPSWYKPDFRIVDGKIKVPKTPGMGIDFDPDYLAKATVVARIEKSNASGASSGSGTH